VRWFVDEAEDFGKTQDALIEFEMTTGQQALEDFLDKSRGGFVAFAPGVSGNQFECASVDFLLAVENNRSLSL
jgi:hypothetical protein